MPGTVALFTGGKARQKTLSIEHPGCEMSVVATMAGNEVTSVAVLRTARKLFDGVVFG